MPRILAALCVMLGFAGLAQAAETKPNVVFILCDDLGYGDVHCLNPARGKIATPNLDQLAADGMIFSDAHSSSAVCTPTRYGVLTGRYNWRSTLQHGVLNGMSKPLIAADRLTVPKLLKEKGYDTACVGKWHLGLGLPKTLSEGKIEDGPTTRGFDYYYGISASLDMPPYAFIENDHFTEAPTAVKELYQNRRGPAAPGFEAVNVLPTLAKKAGEWIEKREGHPFFLYLALNSPHTPLNPSPDWHGKSGLGSYADYVMETDWAIGEVLKALAHAGVADSTLVIVTSDNGCAPYVGASNKVDPMPHSRGDVHQLEEKGHYPSGEFRGYKSDAWDGGHHVPFIARWPGQVKPQSRCTQMVCLNDLMATCAELTGATIPPTAGEDSVSFVSLLRGENKPTRETLVHHSSQGMFAIREGQWKLVLGAGSGGWSSGPKAPPVQLYNMSEDVGEQHNLEAKEPEVVKRLTEKLKTIVAEGRSTPGPKQANDAKVDIFRRGGDGGEKE